MDVLPSGVVIPQYCSIDDVEGHRFCTFQIFKVSELRFQHRTVTLQFLQNVTLLITVASVFARLL